MAAAKLGDAAQNQCEYCLYRDRKHGSYILCIDSSRLRLTNRQSFSEEHCRWKRCVRSAGRFSHTYLAIFKLFSRCGLHTGCRGRLDLERVEPKPWKRE